MLGKHTVEKIGGSSMSRFAEVMRNVILGQRETGELYNRVFIVSAYGGITNMLLEDKKNGTPGVYGKFASGSDAWEDHLETVRARMIEFNRSFRDLGLDQGLADEFVHLRLNGIRDCLLNLLQLRSFGLFTLNNYLPPTRELLSAVGEAHSAYNSTLILQKQGINAKFVDLTGWMQSESLTFDDAVNQAFAGIDYSGFLQYLREPPGKITVYRTVLDVQRERDL